MAPETRDLFAINDNCREAAVLLLIYKDQNDQRVVFIKRNVYNGPHSGQVSLPGGMKEEADTDFKATAIRETVEETGVLESDIEIVGALTPMHIPVSNFCVYPFVGWSEVLPDFHPDKNEVQYLICPTLELLFHPEIKKRGTFKRRGESIITPYFDIDEEMIWGATAMIISEFIYLFDY